MVHDGFFFFSQGVWFWDKHKQLSKEPLSCTILKPSRYPEISGNTFRVVYARTKARRRIEKADMKLFLCLFSEMKKNPGMNPGVRLAVPYTTLQWRRVRCNSVFIKIYANLPPRKRPNVFLIRRTLPTSSLGPWVQAVWRPSCDYTCCAELITHFWSECFIRTASAHHVKLIYIRLRAACRTLS